MSMGYISEGPGMPERQSSMLENCSRRQAEALEQLSCTVEQLESLVNHYRPKLERDAEGSRVKATSHNAIAAIDNGIDEILTLNNRLHKAWGQLHELFG